jgi:predicted SAM-dependent methyltransferase
MKINLGCGGDIREEYINIDIRHLPGVNVVADVTHLPFKDNSVDEILAIDIYEHVSHLKSQKLLKHWVSKLKKGALLFIQCPCINTIVENFLAAEKLKRLDLIEGVISDLFGGQEYPKNEHFTIGHLELMRAYLIEAGIKGNIEYQLDHCNIRFKAYK